MAKRPSIHDVATMAGVSATTVSHALSGKGRLPATTRERVAKVAEEIGYWPSLPARGLASGRTMLLGIQVSGFDPQGLIPHLGYFVDLLNAASSTALERGYGLVVVPLGCPLERVRQMAFDGVVIVDPVAGEPLVEELNSEGKPVVTAGRLPGNAPGRHWVDSDHVAGARMVLDHLRARGCERPALLTTRRGPSYVEDTLAGYRAWCAEQGVRPMVSTLRGGRPTEQASEAAVGRLLDRDRDAPDGIYTTLDVLAIGAQRAAQARGVTAEEFAIASMTDSAVLRAASPAITALDLNPSEIGARSTELLIALIEDRPTGHISQTVPAKLLVRESTVERDRAA